MQRNIAATQPVTRQVVTGAVMTTTGALPAFILPNDLTEMRIVVQVTAASGTTPTLDCALQDSPDAQFVNGVWTGTTWIYTGNKFLQQTGVSMRQISLSRTRAVSQIAAEFPGDLPAGGAAAAAASGPIARLVRIWCIVGGTTPSFTINVFVIGTTITD